MPFRGKLLLAALLCSGCTLVRSPLLGIVQSGDAGRDASADSFANPMDSSSRDVDVAHDAAQPEDAGADRNVPEIGPQDSGFDVGVDAWSADTGAPTDAGGGTDAGMNTDAGGMDCSGACVCAEFMCSFRCAASDCAPVCSTGTFCDVTIDGNINADPVACLAGSVCQVTGSQASNLVVECSAGAVCDVTCDDVSNCTVECRPGTSCSLVCTGNVSNCSFNGCPNGQEQTCAAGGRQGYSCNAPCPL